MEAPAIVDLSASLVPLSIRHAELQLSWSVLEVVEEWTTPDFEQDVGSVMELKVYRVRVAGPLPGRPSVSGEFGMIIRRYGDRQGWWVSPEPEEKSGLSATTQDCRVAGAHCCAPAPSEPRLRAFPARGSSRPRGPSGFLPG
jgi:hypothetical protein